MKFDPHKFNSTILKLQPVNSVLQVYEISNLDTPSLHWVERIEYQSIH